MNNTIEYKGYYSNVEYSAKDGVLHGKIEGINDLVTFETENASDIEKEFQAAVDDYISFCKQVGKEPEKTYRGSFNVRVKPELHRAVASIAIKKGISLNQAVEQALTAYASNQ